MKTYWIKRQIDRKGAKFSLTVEDVQRLLEAGTDLDLIDAMRPRPAEGK